MRKRKPEELKETYIDWLPKIPLNWDVKKISHLFRLGRGRVISNSEIIDNKGNYPVYSSQTENNGVMGKIDTYDFEGDYITWTTDGANAGTVFRRSGKFNCTNVCGTLKPRKDEELDYLKNAIAHETKRFVRQDINPKLMNNQMSSIRIIYPPYSEQKAIATFLDRKTQAIDQLIEKKQQLIEKLKEKRQALITRAVTKGLNPDAPMKDSGIEWLGEVPAHWKVVKVKWLFKKITSGSTPTSSNEDYYKGEIPWVQTGDLNDGIIFQTKKKITEEALKEVSALKIFPENTLLMAMYGATIGKLGVLKNQSATNQACCAMIDPKCNYWFMFYWLLSMRKEIINLAYGGGQPNISQDVIKNISVTTPPIDEQDEIVYTIKKYHNYTVQSIIKIELQIDKLKEYRQSLISAAVTGKIDVRDANCREMGKRKFQN